MDLHKIFPRGFEFFHLGHIEQLAPKPVTIGEAPLIVTCQLTGDDRGLCVVAFDTVSGAPIDESMATEMANILASKFAARLSDQSGELISLLPPELLIKGDGRHRRLLGTIRNATLADAKCARKYEYVRGKSRLPIHFVYLRSQEGLS